MRNRRKLEKRIASHMVKCLMVLAIALFFTAWVVAAEAQEPKRGGFITVASSTESTGGFDPVYSLPYAQLGPVTIPLMSGDFFAGPTGQKKVKWRYGIQEQPQYMTKGLAESWEIPDAKTIVFHIRKGVKWHDKPPVNGREVTAEDIAWSYNRLLKTPTSGLAQIEKQQAGGKITCTAVDRYTLKMEFAKALSLIHI